MLIMARVGAPVAGMGVAVGGFGVAVAGTGVAVGGTGVAVGGVAHALNARTSSVMQAGDRRIVSSLEMGTRSAEPTRNPSS